MSTGEGAFATASGEMPRIERLPERVYAVRRHEGPLDTIDDTRRPLYQFMIMNELVGGPSAIRFHDDHVDVMVGAAAGLIDGKDLELETIPAGDFAVMDYEGPETGLEQARQQLQAWVAAEDHQPSGPIMQIHLMDAIDGDTEQQLQIPLTA